jgi:hypothetical protein
MLLCPLDGFCSAAVCFSLVPSVLLLLLLLLLSLLLFCCSLWRAHLARQLNIHAPSSRWLRRSKAWQGATVGSSCLLYGMAGLLVVSVAGEGGGRGKYWYAVVGVWGVTAVGTCACGSCWYQLVPIISAGISWCRLFLLVSAGVDYFCWYQLVPIIG